ncbi:MAG: EamA family transporter [Elusimicrobia bacterium]|nr:EamA family transporter [Elusimicrobiota bacterium]
MTQTTAFFLGLAVLCWGMSAFFDKLCFRYFPGSAPGTPAQATDVFFVRLALTILLLLVPVAVRWNGVCGAAAGAERMGLFWVGSSVVAAMSGVYFYLIAMSGAEASKIVPLSSTYPLVTFFLAVLFLGESFNPNKLLGTLFVCLGVFFLSR